MSVHASVDWPSAEDRPPSPTDLLSLLFTQAPAAMAVLEGPEHVFSLVNPLYADIVGRQREDLIGKADRDALPILTEGCTWQVLDRVFETGESYSAREVQFPFVPTEGRDCEDRWYNLVVQRTRLDDGSVDGVFLHVVEVTETVRSRLRVEQLAAELELERSRLSLGQRAGRIGTFDRDVRKDVIVWTPDLEVLYGYEPGELNGADIDWIALVHPDDQSRVRETVAVAVRERLPIHVEFRIIRKDGAVAWILADAIVEYRADGSPQRVIGVNIDITDRKQAEDNLQFLSNASTSLSSSLDYETTLNTVAKLAVPNVGDWCAIDMVGSDGQVQLVAVAHKDPERAAWARQLREASPTDLSAEHGLPQVLRTGRSELYPLITDEMLVETAADDRELALTRELGMTSAMVVPIWSEGRPIGAITFVTTESRRRYNPSDLSMAEELASRASLAIDNARLYRQAQSALALRDEFISVASHELKTPVTSLKVYAQMVGRRAKREGDSETALQLAKMESQVDKLTRLIANLLDVSKIEAGKLEYESDEFDVVALVCDLADSPKTLDQTHTIAVARAEPIVIRGDRDRVGQVIINLLTNAIKYSPDTDRVEVSFRVGDGTVTIGIRDYGIGIDPRFHEHVFDRFFQVADHRERTFSGLGMGLYISREIARRHGGDLTVASEKGHGSTFSLILPLAPAGSEPDGAERP